jgi:predicted DCC family thiol-disulfide oxidoreductase YuxK
MKTTRTQEAAATAAQAAAGAAVRAAAGAAAGAQALAAVPAAPDAAAEPPAADTLIVLYDGACPLCRREIAHVQALATRPGSVGARPAGAGLCFVDLSAPGAANALPADEHAALLARFHVQRADGTRMHGAAAFVAMWQRLPGWRWLARIARLPGMLPLLEVAYNGFLRVRPLLQALARRWDRPPRAPS